MAPEFANDGLPPNLNDRPTLRAGPLRHRRRPWASSPTSGGVLYSACFEELERLARRARPQGPRGYQGRRAGDRDEHLRRERARLEKYGAEGPRRGDLRGGGAGRPSRRARARVRGGGARAARLLPGRGQRRRSREGEGRARRSGARAGRPGRRDHRRDDAPDVGVRVAIEAAAAAAAGRVRNRLRLARRSAAHGRRNAGGRDRPVDEGVGSRRHRRQLLRRADERPRRDGAHGGRRQSAPRDAERRHPASRRRADGVRLHAGVLLSTRDASSSSA